MLLKSEIEGSSLEILFLKQSISSLDIISGWLHREYLYLNPGETIEIRKKRMLARANDDQIPLCIVAFLDGVPVSTASVIECDLPVRPEYSPWLASVYTAENFRKKGIGRLVCSKIVEVLKSFKKYENIYLYTPDKAVFYDHLGWSLHENIVYMSKKMDVMKISLL